VILLLLGERTTVSIFTSSTVETVHL